MMHFFKAVKEIIFLENKCTCILDGTHDALVYFTDYVVYR